jgi:2-polyprenyl-3-methyl-5-hydroxy-6-metoxy-1,4-benzoquinol methylase
VIAGANISVVQRARQSLGKSNRAVYEMVASIVARRGSKHGRMCDVGCGAGSFLQYARTLCDSYCGVDVVRYDELPVGVEFVQSDLDAPRWPIDDDSFDVTVSIETIEHLENPRAFLRELVRITRAGGLIIVTTPNQLSLLSKLTLVLKGQFNAFQKPCYPAHITALLKSDLLRIAGECGLVDAQIVFSNRGRVPGTPWHWPRVLRGQAFSDNLAIVAAKPSMAIAPAGVREGDAPAGPKQPVHREGRA